MDTVSCAAGIAGEFASAAINNNMLSVEMSPLLSRLEQALIAEVCDWFGLGESAGGIMLSGGSLANLQALTVVRNHVMNCQRTGVLACSDRGVVLASEAAHTSLHKACMLLGLGTDAVISIAVDENSRMRVDDLDAKLRRARADGVIPLCVVATAGTTTTGSVDPIEKIADVCRDQSLWLHVDAAYGGALILSSRHRGLLKGIERADSITFNPQKWLYVPKTCAMVLFRDARLWRKAFRVSSPYMQSEEELVNQTEVSVQGTRHAEVLKLWMSLQHLGRLKLEGLIDQSIAIANAFAQRLAKRESLELFCQAQTNIVCYRVIDRQQNFDHDAATSRLHGKLVRSGQTFMSLPTYAGCKVIRAVFLNPYIDIPVIERILAEIDMALLGLDPQ
jgi:glutamate/tyrosine decarboxylase-like PLP-dependent enzyme